MAEKNDEQELVTRDDKKTVAQIALRSPIGTPAPTAAGATAAHTARSRGKGATTWT